MKEHHFSESLAEALKKAHDYATNKKYEYLTIDNLMLFLCETPYGKELFDAVNLNTEVFKSNIIDYLEKTVPKYKDEKEKQAKEILALYKTNVKKSNRII